MPIEISVEQIVGVGFWRWRKGDATCHICFQLHEIPCPDCFAPGDTCPPVHSVCGHSFHRHCLQKWYELKQNEMSCPLCRQEFRPAA